MKNTTSVIGEGAKTDFEVVSSVSEVPPQERAKAFYEIACQSLQPGDWGIGTLTSEQERRLNLSFIIKRVQDAVLQLILISRSVDDMQFGKVGIISGRATTHLLPQINSLKLKKQKKNREDGSEKYFLEGAELEIQSFEKLEHELREASEKDVAEVVQKIRLLLLSVARAKEIEPTREGVLEVLNETVRTLRTINMKH